MGARQRARTGEEEQTLQRLSGQNGSTNQIRTVQSHEGQGTLIWEQILFRKGKMEILHLDESEGFCCLDGLPMKRVFSAPARVVLDAVDVFHCISLLEILEEIHFLI